MADINSLIARPPVIDWNSIPDPFNSYAQASNQRSQWDMQNARKLTLADLPRTPDGNPDLSAAALRLGSIGDMEGMTTLAKLADARATQDWTKTYQSGMLDVARQNANKPQIVGSAETGYFAIPTNGAPAASPSPAAQPRQPAGNALPDPTMSPSPRQVAAANAPAPGLQPVVPPVDRTSAQIQQREAEARRLGMDLNDPQVRGFVLTERRPPEQTLSASDRKAILEADEAVSSTEGAISALRRAKSLSKQALGFPGASTVGQGLSLIGSPVGEATAELDNLVGTNALSQLKTIFGGNPTEGERRILLDLQGSSSKPDAVRQKIYDRAIEMAERRLELKRQQAGELRSGTYFRPGNAGPASPTPAPAPAPQAPAAPAQRAQAAPPMQGARQAPDGNWYVETEPGKFARVEQ